MPDGLRRGAAPRPPGSRRRWRSARRQLRVPCHNDLLAANFIAVPGGIRIVDWEYAGMGDRYFDLANFAVNNELDGDGEEAFLAAYLERAAGARASSPRCG